MWAAVYPRGIITFSSALVRASRLKFWKTNPIFLFRTSALPSLSRFEISFPSSQYSPDVGRSRHPSIFIRVLLPEPDTPVSASISPFSTLSEIPFKTGSFISPII